MQNPYERNWNTTEGPKIRFRVFLQIWDTDYKLHYLFF